MEREPSLYEIVMNAARRHFLGEVFDAAERARLTAWLLARRNPGGGFTFPLTPAERMNKPSLLSGEKPKTYLLAENALECETLRLLALFAPGNPEAEQAIVAADRRLAKQCFANVCTTGECPHVSIAYLRFLSVHPGPETGARLRHGLEVLRQHRVDDGRWQKFPFWYTLLWLVDLPADLSKDELAHTSRALERAKKHGISGPGFEVRARIAERGLSL